MIMIMIKVYYRSQQLRGSSSVIYPPGVQEVMGSFLSGTQSFSLSHAHVMLINSSFTFHFRAQNSPSLFTYLVTLGSKLPCLSPERPWTCNIHSLERWFVGVEWCGRQPEHMGIKSQNNKVNIVSCNWRVRKAEIHLTCNQTIFFLKGRRKK